MIAILRSTLALAVAVAASADDLPARRIAAKTFAREFNQGPLTEQSIHRIGELLKEEDAEIRAVAAEAVSSAARHHLWCVGTKGEPAQWSAVLAIVRPGVNDGDSRVRSGCLEAWVSLECFRDTWFALKEPTPPLLAALKSGLASTRPLPERLSALECIRTIGSHAVKMAGDLDAIVRNETDAALRINGLEALVAVRPGFPRLPDPVGKGVVADALKEPRLTVVGLRVIAALPHLAGGEGAVDRISGSVRKCKGSAGEGVRALEAVARSDRKTAPAAWDALLEILDSPEGDGAVTAVGAGLAVLRGDVDDARRHRAVARLVSKLQKEHCRNDAASALGALGEIAGAALPELLALGKPADGRIWFTADALRVAPKDRRALDQLLEHARDEESGSQLRAFELLIELGPVAASLAPDLLKDRDRGAFAERMHRLIAIIAISGGNETAASALVAMLRSDESRKGDVHSALMILAAHPQVARRFVKKDLVDVFLADEDAGLRKAAGQLQKALGD